MKLLYINYFSFLIIFCLSCLTATNVQAQQKELYVLDSLTNLPVTSASIYYEQDDNGTVTDEKGKASIGNLKSSTIKVSHLNYKPKTIKTDSFKNNKLTVFLAPLSNQLREVVISAVDIVGKWECMGIKNANAKEYKMSNANRSIKIYSSDRTFRIINANTNRIVLYGDYVALNNQVRENIAYAQALFLTGKTNILYYSVSKNNDLMAVKYQLPGSDTVTEEIWRKIL